MNFNKLLKKLIREELSAEQRAQARARMAAIEKNADREYEMMSYLGIQGQLLPDKAAIAAFYKQVAEKAKAENNTTMLQTVKDAAAENKIDIKGILDTAEPVTPAASEAPARIPDGTRPEDYKNLPNAEPVLNQAPAPTKPKIKSIPPVKTTPAITKNVINIQTALTKAGFLKPKNNKNPVDGIYGPNTQRAVNAFFASNKISHKGHKNFEEKVAEEAAEIAKLAEQISIKNDKVIFERSYVQKLINEELKKLINN